MNEGSRKVIDAETLAKAVKAVMDEIMSIRDASRAFNINYSSLQRYTANVKKEADKPESSNDNEKGEKVKEETINFFRRRY